MSDDGQKDEITPLYERTVGRLTLRGYRYGDKEFWTLHRDEKLLSSGWQKDLRPRLEALLESKRRQKPQKPEPESRWAAVRLMRRVGQRISSFWKQEPKEKQPEQQKPEGESWWHVVNVVQRIGDKAVLVRVDDSFPKRIDAELCAARKDLAVLKNAMEVRHKPGDQLICWDEKDLIAGRQIRMAEALRERREIPDFPVCRWHDTKVKPAPGMQVYIEGFGADYRNEPEEWKARPEGQRTNPGDGGCWVTLKRSEDRSGTYEVVKVADKREVTLATARTLQERENGIKTANDNRLWNKATFSPALRRQGVEIETLVATEGLTITSFKLNKSQAYVIERTGEDGQKTRGVLGTRVTNDADGKPRTTGRYHDLDSLPKLRALYERSLRDRQPSDRQLPERQPSQERGPQPEPGRPQDAAQVPEKRDDLEERRERKQQAMARHWERILRADEKTYIAGVWCGSERPEKGQVVEMRPAHDSNVRPENRAIAPPGESLPDRKELKILASIAPHRYAVLKASYEDGQKVWRLLGTTRDLQYVKDRCRELERIRRATHRVIEQEAIRRGKRMEKEQQQNNLQAQGPRQSLSP